MTPAQPSTAGRHWSDPRWKVNPETRTVAWLTEQGWDADICNRKKGPISVDLWNYADIVAQKRHGITEQNDTWDYSGDFLFVQATGRRKGSVAGVMAERVRKVLAEPRAQRTLECEGLIWVVGWWKPAKSKVMEPVKREILLEDFPDE